ncbi:MAG: hypothetical protein M5U15_11270 [Kiritimatiellae bacterium]|nr:hypothetical protein [Kiritimatiellia bacterium]
MSRKRPTYKNTPSAGEAGVWLSSMGLSIGLLLVLGLLGLIAVNGLSVFWPKPLLRVTLQSDSASVVEGQTIVAGLLTGARDRMLPAPRTAAPQREWRLQIGNKDVYGQGFRYIVTDDALRTDYPANALVLERMEYGPAIGIPLTLNLPNGGTSRRRFSGFRGCTSQRNCAYAQVTPRATACRKTQHRQNQSQPFPPSCQHGKAGIGTRPGTSDQTSLAIRIADRRGATDSVFTGRRNTKHPALHRGAAQHSARSTCTGAFPKSNEPCQ